MKNIAEKSIEFKRSNSDNKEFKRLIKEFDAILTADYGVNQTDYDEQNIFPKPINMLILYLDNKAIGCGGFKPYNKETAEIKRVYLQHKYRGNGLGKRIMLEIEQWIKEENYPHIILETGDLQYEAIKLYKQMGYYEIDKYPPYENSPASVCYRKDI